MMKNNFRDGAIQITKFEFRHLRIMIVENMLFNHHTHGMFNNLIFRLRDKKHNFLFARIFFANVLSELKPLKRTTVDSKNLSHMVQEYIFAEMNA